MADMGRCKFEQENQWKASNFTKWSWLEMTKDIAVHIKNMQSNKMNIIQNIAWAWAWAVTAYSYIYYVIKLHKNLLHVTSYPPALHMKTSCVLLMPQEGACL